MVFEVHVLAILSCHCIATPYRCRCVMRLLTCYEQMRISIFHIYDMYFNTGQYMYILTVWPVMYLCKATGCQRVSVIKQATGCQPKPLLHFSRS